MARLEINNADRSAPRGAAAGTSSPDALGVEVGMVDQTGTVFPIGVVGGTQPTTDERLDRLEKNVADLRVELQETAGDLRRKAREAASEAAAAASRHSDRGVGALERALLGDTPTDRRRRLLSISAIVLGVTLATIGSAAPGPT